jgi:pectate lyase C
LVNKIYYIEFQIRRIKMKKISFVLLSILLVAAISIWFSCNPFQQSGKKDASNFSVLDESSGARLVITCSIEVIGTTYNGNGEHIDSSYLADIYGENPIPVFRVTNGTVKNVTLDNIGNGLGDGIWLYANSTVDSVVFPDVQAEAVTVRGAGTVTVSNSTFNNGEDRIILINDMCTITSAYNNVNKAGKYIRQSGGKTWKLTSYCSNCTINNMDECIFRSDSNASIFYYHNLTTNCSTIGYPGTNVIGN